MKNIITPKEDTVETFEDIAITDNSWKAFCELPSNQDWNHPDNDHWDTEKY